jgi:hypothetical protein
MTMKVCIQDLTTGKALNVTDLVIDTLELGESGYSMLNEENPTLLAQAIDVAADIARNEFGHDEIDAYTTA